MKPSCLARPLALLPLLLGCLLPTGAVTLRAAEAVDPLDYFKRHLFPLEPMYFIAGSKTPNARFQISFKYQLVDSGNRLAGWSGQATNFYVGYTQTSFWHWNRISAPFEDNNYKPEFHYLWPGLTKLGGHDLSLSVQTGVQHESNGRDGPFSRSLNLAYIRPRLLLGEPGGWQASFAPGPVVYLGDLSDNPDLPRYRGYGDVRLVLGKTDSVQLATIARIGNRADRGSVQLDLSYPMNKLTGGGLTWYLHGQFFTGYGESFLRYRQRDTEYRLGFSLYRESLAP